MAISQRQWRAIGVAVPSITGLTLLGITKTIFSAGIDTNLFSVLSLGSLLGILNVVIAIAIYQNRI